MDSIRTILKRKDPFKNQLSVFSRKKFDTSRTFYERFDKRPLGWSDCKKT